MALIFQTEFVEISKKSVLKPCSEVVPKYETVIGLGLTNQNPDRSSDQLMEAELIENGNSRLQDSMNVMQHLFYSVPGRTAACHGDTGGPMVSKQNGKVVCLIGAPVLMLLVATIPIILVFLRLPVQSEIGCEDEGGILNSSDDNIQLNFCLAIPTTQQQSKE